MGGVVRALFRSGWLLHHLVLIVTIIGLLMMRDRKIICLVSFLLIIVFGVVSVTIYHFRVEKPRFVSVHHAMTEYQKVLDAEWHDPSCTLEDCPKSSKSIPGVPSTRALFTEEERFNLELRGDMYTPPTTHVRSDVGIYDLAENDDGSVTAIVHVSTWHYEVDGSTSGGSDYHRVELIPTDGGYVVMADDTLPETASSQYLKYLR